MTMVNGMSERTGAFDHQHHSQDYLLVATQTALGKEDRHGIVVAMPSQIVQHQAIDGPR